MTAPLTKHVLCRPTLSSSPPSLVPFHCGSNRVGGCGGRKTIRGISCLRTHFTHCLRPQVVLPHTPAPARKKASGEEGRAPASETNTVWPPTRKLLREHLLATALQSFPMLSPPVRLAGWPLPRRTSLTSFISSRGNCLCTQELSRRKGAGYLWQDGVV